MLLQGRCALTLGTDWRLQLPPRIRDAFGSSVRIDAGIRGCWRMYPPDEAPSDAIPAHSATIDARGRLRMPPAVRRHVPVALPCRVTLIGLGGYAELWPEPPR